jgi:hypothetical protein
MYDMRGVGDRLKNDHRPVEGAGLAPARTTDLVFLFGMAAVLCQFVDIRNHCRLFMLIPYVSHLTIHVSRFFT